MYVHYILVNLFLIVLGQVPIFLLIFNLQMQSLVLHILLYNLKKFFFFV